MYHCHLQLYIVGRPCAALDVIKEMPPLEHFTHTFVESPAPEEALSAGADVILANLRGQDAERFVEALLAGKRPEGELILCAEEDQLSRLNRYLPDIAGLWRWPTSEEEIRFRFLRWQQARKTEAELWKVNQYLEALLGSSPNMVWYKDKEGLHRKVNDSFCRIVRKPKEKVEGRDHCFIWDVGPEDALVCAKSDQEVMESKRTCVAEENVKSGKEWKLFVTYKSPLYDWDGSVMGTVGLGLDVTQERAYKRELMQRNHTLETIFTSLDCGILCHNKAGQIISVNQAALRILGYKSREDLINQGFNMIAPSVIEEDKPRLRACIQSLKKVGDSASIEYQIRHTDGKILHIMGNIKLLMENGELYYRRFMLDYTEKKREETEEKRKQDELVQALIVDYNLVCTFDLDTGSGITLRISEKSLRRLDNIFTGEINFQKSMERYIQTQVYEEDRDMLRKALESEQLKKVLSGKQIHCINYRITYRNKVKYYEMKIVRTSDWEYTHSIVLGMRSVDEETRKAIEQRQLMKEALLQADQANQAKSTFLSNMSHDIRTPMNAIIGFTNLAINHLDETDRVGEYLGKIMVSGSHLLSLINYVLDMSRIESGKMHLEEDPCNLSGLVWNLEGIIQADVDAKNLTLQIDADGLVHEDVYCDQVRLNQVLLNVLGNSVKYTPEGGAISLRLTEQSASLAGYGRYIFKIRDNGIGMSPEFLARVFHPFEREQNTTLSKIQGTGLGMSITKNIVELMNGIIEVKSEQGKGTEVTISLPFRLYTQDMDDEAGTAPQEEDGAGEELCVPAAPDFPLPDEAGGSSMPQGIRILLAEDNSLNQEIAQIILEDAGFQVDVAENGEEAVKRLTGAEAGYYQVILMDIQMPVMDGYEATRAIRALDDKARASIPILAMTANAFEEDKMEALRCGMNGHITKPIEAEKLFEALRQVLNL